MSRFDARGLPTGAHLDANLEIAPAEVAKLLRESPAKITIIDVRNGPEYAFAHLPGAMHIPLEDVAAKASKLNIPDDHVVAVMCHHGRRSIPGAIAMREAGFPGAKSIAGGMDIWSQSIDTAVPRYKRDGLRVWPA